MDRLRAIEVFVTIVDHGSFAAAAQALGLSRNMASRHLADLEAYLGARLLNRTTRSLSLTSTGAAYLERAGRYWRSLTRRTGLPVSRP